MTKMISTNKITKKMTNYKNYLIIIDRSTEFLGLVNLRAKLDERLMMQNHLLILEAVDHLCATK